MSLDVAMMATHTELLFSNVHLVLGLLAFTTMNRVVLIITRQSTSSKVSKPDLNYFPERLKPIKAILIIIFFVFGFFYYISIR